ncbi:MAG: hypothetical protein CME65_15765 [Halobacteriovoraceae bacterium]|nr:hypothetical protein [Halobacteriovoraceae bacterium]|tara:strand:+ start:48872 stop:49441 length:570 start_codon:yes stop_codon:yes gene_type:complete
MKIFDKDSFLKENHYDIFEKDCVLDFAKLSLENLGQYGPSEFKTLIEPYKNWKGLYIYSVEGRVLYVGKGNTIKNRLVTHQREIKLEHKSCPIFWLFYFHTFLKDDKVDIYIINIEDEEGRIVLESFYQHKYQSHFDILKNEFDKKLRSKGINKVSPRIPLNSLQDHQASKFYECFLEVIENDKLSFAA